MNKIRKELNESCYSFPFCLLCLYFILLCFGCGGDDQDTLEEVVTPEDFIGTWELIRIDGKTPKVSFQDDFGDEAVEVLQVEAKLVFANDAALFREASMTMRVLIDDSLTLIYLKMRIRFIQELRYVVSVSTVEYIGSGKDVSIEFDFSWETPEIPELAHELNDIMSESERKEVESNFEREIAEEWKLELETYTFDFEENTLTLVNGDKEVYRKR